MPYKIREARCRDAFHIVDLYKHHRDSTPRDNDRPYCLADFTAIIENTHSFILLAEKEDGEAVGFVCGYHMATWGYIDILTVHQVWRKAGIGTSLLAAAERYGQQTWGWNTVQLCVNPFDKPLERFTGRHHYNSEDTIYIWKWKALGS